MGRISAFERTIKMANSTRRALLTGGGIFVGAAALNTLNLSEVAIAGSESANVFQVFAFQWKEGTLKLRKTGPRKRLPLSRGVIPGLLQTMWAQIFRRAGKGYTFGGIMQFKDKASLEAFVQHPVHQALLAWEFSTTGKRSCLCCGGGFGHHGVRRIFGG